MTTPPSPESDQYQIVADLLARQDEVLEQLDALSQRIDATIKEITGDRENAEDPQGELASQDTGVAADSVAA